MPRAVSDTDEVSTRTSEALQDVSDHVEVGTLAIGTDEVGLPHLAGIQDCPDRIVVVIDVNPVPNILASAIHARATTAQQTTNLAGNQLLRMLPRPVVVRAVTNRRSQPKTTHPRPDEVVR